MKSLVLIVPILFIVIGIRFYTFFHNGVRYTDGQQVSIDTTLLTQPQQEGKFQRFTARLSHGERVFITTASYPAYEYGQQLYIEGKLVEKRVGKSMIYTMSFPTISYCHHGVGYMGDERLIDGGERVCHSSLLTQIAQFVAPARMQFIDFFHKSLGQPESGLLLGIVFGFSENMPKDFQKALSQAGVLHVIAASGMNVTMIAGFLTGVFGKIMRRQYALVVCCVILVFYAALAGFSASIVRATIMGVLVFVAQIIGRQSMALYGLLVAAAAMLFLQPFLLFDVGFQLSFVATWGLIVFSPILTSWYQKESKIGKVLAESDFLTTFIAQMVTLPILLATFGTYSPASVLTNLLVLWMIPLLMIMGGVGALIGIIMPSIGAWLLYLCLPLLFYFEQMVWFFASLPVVVHLEGLPWEMYAGYYLLLFAIIFWSKEKAQKREIEAKITGHSVFNLTEIS